MTRQEMIDRLKVDMLEDLEMSNSGGYDPSWLVLNGFPGLKNMTDEQLQAELNARNLT